MMYDNQKCSGKAKFAQHASQNMVMLETIIDIPYKIDRGNAN